VEVGSIMVKITVQGTTFLIGSNSGFWDYFGEVYISRFENGAGPLVLAGENKIAKGFHYEE
jgi:hypothetical protein